MKKFLEIIVLLVILAIVINYRAVILEFITDNFIYDKDVKYEANTYTKKTNFKYVSYTNDFVADNYQDILNIIYSGINNGTETFYFYCGKNYKNCKADVSLLINDSFTLSNINNFVHPYNSYDKLYVSINNYGRIEVITQKSYNNNQILSLNNKVDYIYNKIITNKMTDKQKIKKIHDYIIKTTVYDQKKANDVKNGTNSSIYESQIAIGPLIQGYGICGGYTDAMALFLDKMGITNYKIASNSHIWNLVKLNGKWYHLDLTWDDPVISTGENIIINKFFLISTKNLENIDTTQHEYYKKIYKEAN